jgi:hypothetical protein
MLKYGAEDLKNLFFYVLCEVGSPKDVRMDEINFKDYNR